MCLVPSGPIELFPTLCTRNISINIVGWISISDNVTAQTSQGYKPSGMGDFR